MSSWLKSDVKKISCSELTACGRLAIFLCQKSTASNRSAGVMEACLEGVGVKK